MGLRIQVSGNIFIKTVTTMIKTINLIIAFISLYLTIVWLIILLFDNQRNKEPTKVYPLVSIIIPAYNEEDSIKHTIRSVLELDYPKEKLELIVVNDGSTDNTKKVAAAILAEFPDHNTTLLNKKNEGSKASALNAALKVAKGEFVACVDADSMVDKDALKYIIPHFSDPKNGAVISVIKVNNPQNFYEKMQRIEYILGVLTRKLMSAIGTLAMTPGVLSVYRADVLRKIGEFEVKNMTEDFEIALRLKAAGYNIKLETRSITYTNVPNNFKQLWRQRIRWFRGFFHNHVKYKNLFFDKKQPIFGYFQLPLNILSIPLLLVTSGIIFYGTFLSIREFIRRSLFIDNYFLTQLLSFPTLKELMLGQDLQLVLPLTLAGLLGFYIFYQAHREIKERVFEFPVSIWVYFVVFPYLTSVHWISAISQEIFKTKKKW